MGYARFIARRHLTRRKKKGFISLISLISIGGVGVGVMALIVVLSVMSGFDTELKKKIVNVQPHLRIEKIGGVDQPEFDIQKILSQNLHGLVSISQFIEGQAILKAKDHATGVVVKGVDVEREDLSIFSEHIIAGELSFDRKKVIEEKRQLLFFKKEEVNHYGGIVIGRGLAATLGLDIGDVVHFISPASADIESVFDLKVKTYPFIVRGVFNIGMNDFDTSLALIDIRQAQKAYQLGNKVTGISLRFDNVDMAETMKWHLSQFFTNEYIFRSWYDLNHSFFQALKVEKSVMTILLALIVLVAAFNIVSTLTMVVMEKTKDIGILRAIGATKMGIRRIFVLEGFTIGIVGVVFGAASGLWLSYNLNPAAEFIRKMTGIEIFPKDIYYFDQIPSEVHMNDVTAIIVFAVIVCIFAGLYPAHRAAKLNPVEALHHE